MTHKMITGLNHITLAVADLERAIGFYRDVLGLDVRAQWDQGAYFGAGALWLCLTLDAHAAAQKRGDYTHIAFDVEADDFVALSAHVRRHAPIWKDNSSEGNSLYFLDPDGHKLELHVGSLETRLAHYRANSDKGVTIF